MSVLQTFCTFSNCFPYHFHFTLPIFRLNEFWGGWKLDPWTFKRIQRSVQVQGGWPFLAPLVDKHLHSRSFPALNIFREEFQFEGTGHKYVKQSSSLGPCQLLPESFISKLMRWEFIDMLKVVKFPFCCLFYQGVIFVSPFFIKEDAFTLSPWLTRISCVIR